jgi:peptidoglycan/xylan/chitin deacetylase (PgdA/CDA1 family)
VTQSGDFAGAETKPLRIVWRCPNIPLIRQALPHMSKRLLLSRILQKTGLLRLMEALPSKPGILVLNHHRIGDAQATRFDRGVFSQTPEGLDEQIQIVRRRMPVIAGDELESLVTGKRPLKRTYAVFTFDDGYLDNYTKAFPVLTSHNVPAIFFPVTQYAGTNSVPWWDEIAYLVRNTQARSISVRTPAPLLLDVGEDREQVILQLLRHYKRPDNSDGSAFLSELRESTGCSVPDPGRRFLNWDEARLMARAGMEFGSHTCSHTILSQQSPEAQQWELEQSRQILEGELGLPIHSLAYPVGSRTAFTAETEEIAAKAGYSSAFAFHGGWNRTASMTATHLNRFTPAEDPGMMRMEITFLTNAFMAGM